MANGSMSKTLVWILMALLIFGLGGFGITNLSGNIRSIGKVGDKEIPVARYVTALQEEMRAVEAQTGQPLSFAKARDLQLDQIALAKLIAFSALDDETAKLGISVGDGNLRDQMLQIQGFRGLDGTFDREAYKFYLDRTGRSEAEFEAELRSDLARGILQQAILAGAPAGETYADTMIRFLAERRDFTWAALDEADLETSVPAPTEAQLTAYHQDNAPRFTLPERKRLTYVWLSPEMLIDSVEVDEKNLRALYDERGEEFNEPERRLVERLVFADDAAAEAAKIAIEAGDKSFDDIVAERGLELSDVDLGDVRKSELGEAGDAVFGIEPGTVVGPYASDLGPALFRMNGVLAARSMTFEEARETLHEELAIDRARRQIDDLRDDIDDLLAGGASLEEVATETAMQLAKTDWTPEVSDDAAGYAAFQEEAGRVTADDFPAVFELDDGGIAAMRLDELLAPELQPLDSVRDEVAEAWQLAETMHRLKAQADALLEQVDADTDMAALGLSVTEETGITRGAFIPGTAPDFVSRMFSLEPGQAAVFETPDRVLIARLDGIAPPDQDNPDVGALHGALVDQVANGQTQDLFQYFINDVQTRAGLELNQQAINAVNANF